MYQYKGGEKRVCFHSSEIRGEKGPFSNVHINRSEFLEDLSRYMRDLNICLISSTLDKYNLCNEYSDPYNPYELCMDFILERIVKYYLKIDEKIIVILESRGKREDKNLLEHIKKTIDYGTRYVEKSFFRKIRGVYFNPKWCRESNEKKSYFGLELADLISYPIHKYAKTSSSDRAFESIENKILGYEDYIGKGFKKFP